MLLYISAFSSGSGSLHTVLNSQALNYETSNLLEVNYQRLAAKRSSHEFHLVFVCCQSRHRTDSIIESLFTNNKISPVNLAAQDIRQYLNQNLLNRGCFSALEKHSVRVLISERSGNGKSSHVTKLDDECERAVDTLFEACFSQTKYQRGCYYLKIIHEILINRQTTTGGIHLILILFVFSNDMLHYWKKINGPDGLGSSLDAKIVGYYEFSNSGYFKNDPSPSFIGFFSTNSSYDRQGSEIENLWY